MGTVGLFVHLRPKPGKEEEVAKFLESALPLARNEPRTLQWFAVRFADSSFGIFDTFDAPAGREAHLGGPIAAALMAKAPELLAELPRIEGHDVLAAKT
jgi:quinol monooxygenase YgiN